MFRQIHIFHQGDMIFSYNLALGLNNNDIANLIPVIKSYIRTPSPGKVYQRLIGEYQVYHCGTQNLYFLVVVDKVDELSYIEEILKKIMNKFQELYPDPSIINIDTKKKILFLEFLYEQQKNLRSKITLIGPKNSGKTTLFNMLKSDDKKRIMNFAEASSFESEDLVFDIWDFIISDNFSNLWSKFVAGSDLVILIFDASNFDLKSVHHFLEIKKKEASYARLLIIANKNDLIHSDEDIKLMKNEIGLPNINELSILSPDARIKILELIRESLQLKKGLPPDYGNLIESAIKFEESGNLTAAINKYKELINIANQFQDSNSISSFQEELDKLEKQRKKLREAKKEVIKQQKFSAPTQFSFPKKPALQMGVDNQTGPQIKPVKPPQKVIFPSQNLQHNAEKITSIGKKEKTSKLDNLVKESQYDKALSNLIQEGGSILSLNLCKEYITHLQEAIGLELTLLDLKIAADLFIQAEKKK